MLLTGNHLVQVTPWRNRRNVGPVQVPHPPPPSAQGLDTTKSPRVSPGTGLRKLFCNALTPLGLSPFLRRG